MGYLESSVGLVLDIALTKFPEHIHWPSCPDLAREKEEVWPSRMTLQDKMCGTGEDLKRTILFVIHAGIDI